jgi:hypothetical protein
VKRICLLGAAIAGLLIIGVTASLAATPHASKKKAPKPTTLTTKLNCVSQLSLQVANGDTTVVQGETDGTQWGTAKCGAPLGSGAAWESFTTDDAGNISGKWQQWFKDGSVFGTFELTPNDPGPPTTTSFAASSYTGTLIIKNGTGADKKDTGTGTLSCSTADAVHFTCNSKVKVIQPVTATSLKGASHGGG